ncbi:DUF3089 domain-containing protein [Novosphingobium sp. FSY-8]|uniref:DUF3089 domain-containing protein n=1 Tax=Novosphingobium ovatum TaxID=1908523 RepID=A0ABW9XD91_9SPHN|nr:DUF3089 domain-containing protein [Novosphingobium ovatum]NBC36465.1 DUF3089 domain-containing protein [Novosphingobium ovatum]
MTPQPKASERGRRARWLWRGAGLGVAGVALMIGAFGVMQHWAAEMSAMALVPAMPIGTRPAARSSADYADAALWIARGEGSAQDPAHWLPRGADAPQPIAANVFFIHPTGHFDRFSWNADTDNPLINARSDLLVRGLASPFAGAEQVWAPRYRQATFGAFLTDRPDGQAALDLAYGDVRAAFDAFVAQADPHLPIVLAGHSQGALHLMRLMRDRVAGQPIAERVAAAYVIGWPVSLTHDLPRMGLPACDAPDQAGCVLSWQSFAQPADTATVLAAYARFPGLDGQSRAGSRFLCVNPITGRTASDAPASANPGTLVPDATLTGGRLVPGMVGAQCGADGFLMIGSPPQMGPFAMPGNNFHVYDIPLFWESVRLDVARRVGVWHAARPAVAAGRQADAGANPVRRWWQRWL